MTRPAAGVAAAIEEAHRQEWGRVLASTARLTRDLDLAEDCVEDAYLRALDAWDRDGIPVNPGAWLTTTARRRALDLLRRDSALRARYPLLIEPAMEETDDIPDERLRLIFTCCHPALAREAQVALTLRLLCGLNTVEIARMFLVPLPTMAARITRAKKKIATARIPYRAPAAPELPDRLDPVLTVIYLIYSAGHTSRDGEELDNPALVERAIHLARALVSLMPDEREARGLLALMLLNAARRGSRTGESGELVLLENQDRSRWDREMIAEGSALVVDALTGGRPGKYGVQAAIAALHADAPSWEEIDWLQIHGLYGALQQIWPSPVVALNRIAARSMVDGPQVALAELVELEEDGRLAAYHYLPAIKADLLRRLGRSQEAALSYKAALDLATNGAEQSFLRKRLTEVTVNAQRRLLSRPDPTGDR